MILKYPLQNPVVTDQARYLVAMMRPSHDIGRSPGELWPALCSENELAVHSTTVRQHYLPETSRAQTQDAAHCPLSSDA